MIDRYQLRYFLAVVDEGNFSRAAQRMNVTQPTLSVGVAKLEQEVGARLLLRNNRRVQLTEAGARFLDHARAIEREFGAVEGAMRQGASRRRVRLGALTTVPTALVERAVRAHRAASEPDDLEIVEGSERELLAALQRGRIDTALTVLHGGPREEPLFAEGYSLAMAQEHPLAGAAMLEPEALAGEVMIVRRHCEALAATSRHFTERGVRPAFALRSTSDERVLAMVRAGLGITVMPDSYGEGGIAQPRLAGFDRQRIVGLLHAPGFDAAATSSILAALREVGAAQGAGAWGTA